MHLMGVIQGSVGQRDDGPTAIARIDGSLDQSLCFEAVGKLGRCRHPHPETRGKLPDCEIPAVVEDGDGSMLGFAEGGVVAVGRHQRGTESTKLRQYLNYFLDNGQILHG